MRLPDLTEQIYKISNEIKVTLEWSINFSQSTNFYDEVSKKLIHLASQELGLIPKEENYLNPYREAEKKKAKKIQENQKSEEKPQKKKKEKNSRGPRLQSSRSGGDL